MRADLPMDTESLRSRGAFVCVCVWGGGGSDSETVHARALVHAGTKRYECVLCLCDVSLLPYGNASQAEELLCSLRH